MNCCGGKGPGSLECNIDNAEHSNTLVSADQRISNKTGEGKPIRTLAVAAVIVVVVLLLGVVAFTLAFMPGGFAVQSEDDSYEVSATYPMKDLVDKDFFAVA